MIEDDLLFMPLEEAKERKIYVVDDFSIDIFSQDDVTHRQGIIVNVYHMQL
jgi:hypothetical protein